MYVSLLLISTHIYILSYRRKISKAGSIQKQALRFLLILKWSLETLHFIKSVKTLPLLQNEILTEFFTEPFHSIGEVGFFITIQKMLAFWLAQNISSQAIQMSWSLQQYICLLKQAVMNNILQFVGRCKTLCIWAEKVFVRSVDQISQICILSLVLANHISKW